MKKITRSIGRAYSTQGLPAKVWLTGLWKEDFLRNSRRSPLAELLYSQIWFGTTWSPRGPVDPCAAIWFGWLREKAGEAGWRQMTVRQIQCPLVKIMWITALGDNPFKRISLSWPNSRMHILQLSSRPSQIFHMGRKSRVGQCATVFQCLLNQT